MALRGTQLGPGWCSHGIRATATLPGASGRRGPPVVAASARSPSEGMQVVVTVTSPAPQKAVQWGRGHGVCGGELFLWDFGQTRPLSGFHVPHTWDETAGPSQ